MKTRRKKIGIMGGTFDPVHMGHLILAEKAYEQLHLDRVWFMPSGNPPHKQNREGQASDEQRVEMVRRAISGNPHFELSLAEMHEEGYTYTYHTLEALKAEHPDTDYYFIIGADSLYDFEKWRAPERICRACTLVVATRNHTSVTSLEEKMKELSRIFGGTFLRLDTTNMDISSKMLRAWMEENKSLRYYVPDSVIQYIQEQKIYKRKDAKRDEPL